MFMITLGYIKLLLFRSDQPTGLGGNGQKFWFDRSKMYISLTSWDEGRFLLLMYSCFSPCAVEFATCERLAHWTVADAVEVRSASDF